MEPNERLVLRVKYKNEMKFLAVPVADLNPGSFAHRVARAFKVILKEGDTVKFYDNLDTPISESIFAIVLKTFHNGSCFFVNVEFKTENCDIPAIITPRMLKQHFIEKGNEQLIADCESAEKAKMDLTDAQKCHCVNLVADYGVSLFGLSPLPHQYHMLAAAAVELINGLKSKTGKPTDILINKTNNGTAGRLYNRFRYLRQKSKNIEENNLVPTTESQENQNDEHSMNSLLWLKTAPISQENIPEIRKKLHQTRRLRDEIFKRDTVELMQEFPYFFAFPPLISDDFLLKFKTHQNELNVNALIENWSRMSQGLVEILDKYYPKQMFEKEWSEDVNNFLILLRLLPFRQGARSIASAETFKNSVKRLIVFSNIANGPIAETEEHQNTQPFIIAKGASKLSITRYSIMIDNDEIQLPDDFSFAQVIDVFFKMHYVFEIKFDERLQNAMFYLKKFMYKMNDPTRTSGTKMVEMHERLVPFLSATSN